jgi:hypothetical protein
LAFSVVVALALPGGLGCDVSQHCDPGQIYMHYACYDPPQGGADGGIDSDVDVVGNDGNDAAGACAQYEGFGATCTVVSQCPCGLDSCNTFMGANYCTRTHCLADPTICPPGWTCLDVSAFDPATGSACVHP